MFIFRFVVLQKKNLLNIAFNIKKLNFARNTLLQSVGTGTKERQLH